MKNRIELARHFKELGFKKGAEVGVCDGRYSEILMQEIPGLHLFGVDPYSAYEVNGSVSRKKETMDDNLRRTHERLDKYPTYTLVIKTSVEAAKDVPDGSLDFVFIDALHEYEHVKEDIHTWYPKVRKGGILSGHDYYVSKSGKVGVMKAVDEFVVETEIFENRQIHLQTTEWDETAHRDDRQPDWYFIV
jgi:hypothetical protein